MPVELPSVIVHPLMSKVLSVVVFTIVKVIGAAYLVFLGIQAIRHRKTRAMPDASVAPRSECT